MTSWTEHLAVVPVALPMLVAAITLLFNEGRRRLKAVLGVVTALALVAVAVVLLLSVAATGAAPAWTYALGGWAAPHGIVLVVDRLSAMMLALMSLLGLGALLFSLARWAWGGPRFHTLFLLLLAGVNGAVLTGDLFNLFVFFEVMLTASYGLVLHGSGEKRVRAGLHYVAINLTASMLFLIGASLVYGATGTLNMADLAARMPDLAPGNARLLAVASAILATAFLIKAAMWPTGFWLPTTYAAASAPAAAVLAILSKVGVYVVLRLSLLLFGEGAGAFAGFGAGWLLAGGIATILYGTFGALATRELPRAAGYCVMVSSGTVLAAAGIGGTDALAGALFYMAGSILAGGALFLIAEILERDRPSGVTEARVFVDEYADPYEDGALEEAGPAIPAAVALASVGFLLCGLLLAGIPPFAGFIGKLAILLAVTSTSEPLSASAWALIATLTVSSLGILVGLVRFGIALLWEPSEAPAPVLRRVEFAAVAGLLLPCLALSLWGEAALAYAGQTAAWLHQPGGYMEAVLGAPAPEAAIIEAPAP